MKFNRPFCLFSFHKDQKYIDTTGKTTLKLGNLQSLKGNMSKESKDITPQGRQIF